MRAILFRAVEALEGIQAALQCMLAQQEDRDPLAVPCPDPDCAAPAGVPCTISGVQQRTVSHGVRFRQVEAELRADTTRADELQRRARHVLSATQLLGGREDLPAPLAQALDALEALCTTAT